MKNKNLWNFVAFLLFSTMCLGFVACGDDKDEPKDNDGASTKGIEAIDLGLSVKWANCNVGADKPEAFGNYFAWGEIEPKSNYSRSNYSWYQDGKFINPGGLTDISGSEYDVAHVKWGGKWRMPTSSEVSELVNRCIWKSTTLNNVNVYQVTGPSGKSIFLPAALRMDGSSLNSYEGDDLYWASTKTDNGAGALVMQYNDEEHWASSWSPWDGGVVRPVSD